MNCVKCKTHNGGPANVVKGLCSFCFEEVEQDARDRGYNLRRAPGRGEADSFKLNGISYWYWRGWRAEEWKPVDGVAHV